MMMMMISMMMILVIMISAAADVMKMREVNAAPRDSVRASQLGKCFASREVS